MNKYISVILFVCIASPPVVNAQQQHISSHRISKKKNKKEQYGIASFYANKFNGRHTANGEIFNQKNLTAASNTVALNMWVRVTNLLNKKKVIVKINDRMHFRNKRLIDLSHAAAKKLGYTGWGLARVKVEILGKRKPEKEPGAEYEN
ncbi:MAG TPA: septal ring lytic transglycosylase RlpA family protein [Puia sp.]|nr:septal ring lytic transglycosylase RlpA family protein [Puia sp.]